MKGIRLAYMDEQMLPKDPALPQLQIAWNPELMLEIFRHTLRPLGEPVEYDCYLLTPGREFRNPCVG